MEKNMRKMMVLVAFATFMSGHVEANEAFENPVVEDSLSTGNNIGKLGGKSQAKNVIGGVLGSLFGKGNTNQSEVNDETTSKGSSSENVSEGNGVLGGAIGDALGSLFGNITSSKLSAEKISGTWNYTSSKCVLESDNLMKQAGSEMLVAPLEKKLNKGLERIGMKPGSYSFTIKEDGTFTSNMGGRTLNGKYTLDTEKKTITMIYLGGLFRSTMNVVVVNGKLGLLYDSDKLLTFASTVASISNSATMKGLQSILNAYDGMKIGLEFKK